MIKYIVIRGDFRGTCSLFICRNAEGVSGVATGGRSAPGGTMGYGAVGYKPAKAVLK